MDNFYNWPLSKQYLAAHYYLSEEKPISISEAQRAQLGALHLFVSFGKYSPEFSIPDLNLCSQAERKKRVDEWKKLSVLTKSTAMQKFLDLITSLFPNWTRSRKLMFEFQAEWKTIEGGPPEKKDEKPKETSLSNISNFSRFRRSIGRSMISSYDFSKLETEKKLEKKSSPKKSLRKNKKSLFNRTQSIDIQNSIYSFREFTLEPEQVMSPVLANSIKRYKTSLTDKYSLRHFVEDLQSHKAGNIRDTSATKFPKVSLKKSIPPLTDPDPPINFDKELRQYRRSLLQKEFNRYKNIEPPTLHSEFDKMHERLSSLKLSLQTFSSF
jgi:hypothetical protein